MCLYPRSAPLKVQSWASLSLQVGRPLLRALPDVVLGFLPGAGGFPAAARCAAACRLAERRTRRLLHRRRRLLLAPSAVLGHSPAVCRIPTGSASPPADRLAAAAAHRRQPGAPPAPVRVFWGRGRLLVHCKLVHLELFGVNTVYCRSH